MEVDDDDGAVRLVQQGAEAKLYRLSLFGRDCIVKERFPKIYRHPDLDARLTLERTRAELRAISKCRSLGIQTPAIYLVDKFRSAIYMEYLRNTATIKDIIDKLLLIENESVKNILEDKLAASIGAIVGTLHRNNIIHGDLTSSNILISIDHVLLDLTENHSVKITSERADLWKPELVLIDFGLASISSKAEDKGVDLYVLERALLSSHKNAERLNKKIIESYVEANEKQRNAVISKLDEVRARGRKREMIGWPK